MQTKLNCNLLKTMIPLTSKANLFSNRINKCRVYSLIQNIIIKDGLIDSWIRTHSLRNNKLQNDQTCVLLLQAKRDNLHIQLSLRQYHWIEHERCMDWQSNVYYAFSEPFSFIKQAYFHLNSSSKFDRTKMLQDDTNHQVLKITLQLALSSSKQTLNFQDYKNKSENLLTLFQVQRQQILAEGNQK